MMLPRGVLILSESCFPFAVVGGVLPCKGGVSSHFWLEDGFLNKRRKKSMSWTVMIKLSYVGVTIRVRNQDSFEL